MYENNYNYVDIGENKEKHGGSAKKTAALLIAVVIAGGASGFGGAYLQNRLNADTAVQQTESADAPSSEKNTMTRTVQTDNKAAQTTAASQSEPAAINSLLGGSADGNVLTTEQIVTKVSPSVVSIKSEFSSGTATGTGIIMTSDGYIITNAHVVQTDEQEYVSGNDGYSPFGNDPYDFFGGFFGGGSYQTVTKQAEKVTVMLSDDENETEYTATIIGTDANSDLAV
ncbi:MAG: trypsin-like peptidase domain-containing protein, partial [Oscillospiraceae bacterium]|nr:trypsin-like peptidase domain-containing protein [Oscillospiraceae bacterium]